MRRTPTLGAGTELVFIEGHSRDRTWEEILRVAAAFPEREIRTLRQTGIGKGNAVREAILASAVIGSVANSGDSEAALAHYSTRLLSGFLRHLEVCRQFYISASRSEWWDSEQAQLDRGIEWTRFQLSTVPKPQYRLVGFDLEQIS